jgi:anti-anti-sigma factor
MIFRTKQQDGFTVLVFQTPNLLNGLDIEAVEKSLETLLDGGAHRFLLDFHRVKFASSQALSMTLRVHLRLEKVPEGKLILCGLNPQLMDAVKIMRLDRLIPVFPTRRDAIKAQEKNS